MENSRLYQSEADGVGVVAEPGRQKSEVGSDPVKLTSYTAIGREDAVGSGRLVRAAFGQHLNGASRQGRRTSRLNAIRGSGSIGFNLVDGACSKIDIASHFQRADRVTGRN